jgi:hypothetical protein
MRALKQLTPKKIAAKKQDAPMPKWLECTWRRQPCGKTACPVCSLLQQERAKLVSKHEPEEFIEDVLDDLRYSGVFGNCR